MGKYQDSVRYSQARQEATRLNHNLNGFMEELREFFNVPVFAEFLDEQEVPEDEFNYIVVESGDMNETVGNALKTLQDNVTVSFFTENRPDLMLDTLDIINIGSIYKLSKATTAQRVRFSVDNTNRQIVTLIITFTRPVKSGC